MRWRDGEKKREINIEGLKTEPGPLFGKVAFSDYKDLLQVNSQSFGKEHVKVDQVLK